MPGVYFQVTAYLHSHVCKAAIICVMFYLYSPCVPTHVYYMAGALCVIHVYMITYQSDTCIAWLVLYV